GITKMTLSCSCLDLEFRHSDTPFQNPAEGKTQSDRLLALFLSPNTDRVFNGTDEDFAVANLSCLSGFDDGCNGGGNLSISENDLNLDLGEKIDSVLTATINFCVPLLPPKTLDLAYCHPLNAHFGQCLFDLFQFERLDNGLDLLHRRVVVRG